MIIRPIVFIKYRNVQYRDLQGEYVGSESEIFVVLCEIEQQLAVWLSRSVELALVQSLAVLRIHLFGEVGTLILVKHVLEYKIFGIKRCSC